MPIATASSAYVLEDRASPAMAAIRREATRTTAALRGTGQQLDRVGSPSQLQRVDRLGARMRGLAGEAERMDRRVSRATSRMEGAIRRDTLRSEARIDVLSGKIDELGRMRAAPRVELDGYAATRAQIADLKRQLGQLGRTNAVAGVRPGAAQVVAGAAGGGPRSGTAIGTSGLNFGTANPAVAAGVLASVVPIVQSLGGATLALGASLTGAALGGGAVALAGGGALAAGIGAIASVAGPAAKSLEETRKAQERYNEAVRDFGRASTQARTAKRELDQAMARTPPGGREYLRETRMMRARWARVTRPGQEEMLGLGAYAARRVRSRAPFLGQQVNQVAGATRGAGQDFADYLTGPQSLLVVRDLSRSFASNLDEAEGIAENLVGTFGNIARASTPFFHEGMVFLERWTGGWERNTRDITNTRRTIGGYIDDLRAWGRVANASFDLLADLIMPGRHAGRSLADDLTVQLRTWERWAERNPERIRSFFGDAVESTKDLAGGAAGVVRELQRMADLLTPILSRFAQLADVGGGAGLLLPAALSIGLSRTLGGRGPASMPSAAGGAGGAAAVAAGAAAGLAGGRRLPPGQQRAFQRVYGGMPGAVYGAPVGSTRRTLRGDLRGLGGRAAGLARPVGYFALANAALQAASAPGGLGGRLDSAVSGLTFGLIPRSTTRGQLRQQGAARAMAQVDRMRPAGNIGDLRRQIADLERRRATAMRGSRGGEPNTLERLGRGVVPFGYKFIGRRGEEEAKRNAAAADQYAKSLRGLREEERALTREHSRMLDVMSEQRGAALADSFREAYKVLRGRKGPEQAMRETLDGVYRRMRRMRPAGAKILGDSVLSWARQMERKNPAISGEVDRLTSRIERRFSRMGKRVRVVNGVILTGSKKEWAGIREAMSDPVEQARQRISDDMTAIQRQAIGSLRAMGHSQAGARSIVRSIERGRSEKQAKSNVGRRVLSGDPSFRARGGRLPGQGLADKVPFAGGVAAPGETWIANRHTERRVDRMLAPYGTTLHREIEGEVAPHGAPLRAYQRGGRAPGNLAGHTGSRGAGLMGASPALGGYAAKARRYGLRISSGRRPGSITSSGNVSLHSSGDAIDVAGAAGAMLAYARSMASQHGAGLDELIHTPMGFGIKNGRRVPPYATADHFDHVHVGDRTPSGGGALGIAGAGLGLTVPHVRLRAPRSGMRGIPGALRDRAGQIYAEGLERQINRRLDRMGAGAGGNLSGFSGGGSADANRALARRMMLAFGFGAEQWPPLNRLWTKESGFNNRARNPSSGAFGIPQSLPASKMGPAAVAGDPAAQIKWGLGYIKGRYGTPSRAWAHSQARNWYSRGGLAQGVPWYRGGGEGVVRRPTVIGVGDNPRGEDVSVRPRPLGPPRRRSRGAGGAAGVSVTIQRMEVTYNRRGDLRRVVRDELREAMEELREELDEGVDADEEALLA